MCKRLRHAVLAVAVLTASLAMVTTAAAQNRCLGGKTKCAAKKAFGLLNCYSKAQRSGTAVDAGCLLKVKTKFDGGSNPAAGCFARLEAKNVGPCATTNDTGSMEAKIDAFVADVVDELENGTPATSPTPPMTTPPTATTTPVGLTATATPSAVATPGVVNNQRCTGNTRTTCTANADCSGVGGTCELWLGGTVPLSAGGVSTCLTNQFAGGISGTFNVDTGASAGSWLVRSRVYTGPTISEPCPLCENDPVANDGVRGGTCMNGLNVGLTCDTDGSSVQFGDTSLDCAPLAGSFLGIGTVDLSNTTGSDSLTLSSASPNCRAAGTTGSKCACDTCNDVAATACSTNADCPDPAGPIGPICGGKRCLSGPNIGAACTANSECPSGACGIPGANTRYNACDDAVCDPTVGNEGQCTAGPFEQFCGPVDTFRGCILDEDCPRAGDTCSVGKLRECFTDNGMIGNSITATGMADPSDPILASVHCVTPTYSTAVNVSTGLPGPERLELPVHVTHDGSVSMCPTGLSFFTNPGTLGVLDRGWMGIAHDEMMPTRILVTVAVTGCAGSAPTCGACSYAGPLPNP